MCLRWIGGVREDGIGEGRERDQHLAKKNPYSLRRAVSAVQLGGPICLLIWALPSLPGQKANGKHKLTAFAKTLKRSELPPYLLNEIVNVFLSNAV